MIFEHIPTNYTYSKKNKKKKKPWENKVTALITFIIVFFLGEKTHFFGKYFLGKEKEF